MHLSTHLPTHPTMHMTTQMNRNEAWLVARQCAQACGTYSSPFEPPEWVLVAIQAAANGVVPDLPVTEVTTNKASLRLAVDLEV